MMAYKPPLDVGDLYSVNYKSVRAWIEQNKGIVKAKPNKTWLYSGRDYDLEVVAGLPLGQRKEFMGTPMWKRIEKIRKRMRGLKLPCDFQTLEDVLKTIRDHPTIVDRDRRAQRFSNAYECFSEIEGLTELLPDAKRVSRESWDRLSEIFAGNAEGDVHILDGAADDYGKLRADKILLRKELQALLKNGKLSVKGNRLLLKKILKYGAEFDSRYTQLIEQLDKDKSRLKAP